MSGNYVVLTSRWTRSDIIINIIKAVFFQGDTTQVGGALWFVATLFEINVLYSITHYLLRKVISNRIVYILQIFIAILLLLFGFWCFNNNKSFMGIDRLASCYCLYVMGIIFKGLFRFYDDHSSIGKFTSAIISLLILCFAYTNIEVSLVNNQYGNPIWLIIVSACGWILVYYISEILSICLKRHRFLFLGRKSMWILALHFLGFKIVNVLGVVVYNKPFYLIAAFPVLFKGGCWWILYLVIGLAFPVIVSIGYKFVKNKVVGLFVDTR